MGDGVREMAQLLVSLGCLASLVFLRRELHLLPGVRWMVGAGVAWTVAAVATVAEDYAGGAAELLNGVEHLGYLAHVLCLAAWVATAGREKAP